MRILPLVFLLSLGFALPAQAQCRNAPECLNLGIGKLDPKIAAILGAGVAAVATVGAAASTVRQSSERPLPVGVLATTGDDGRLRLELPLIPTLAPVPQSEPAGDETRRVDAMFRLNDTLTNVALAVGSLAILTSIIVGIAKK